MFGQSQQRQDLIANQAALQASSILGAAASPLQASLPRQTASSAIGTLVADNNNTLGTAINVGAVSGTINRTGNVNAVNDVNDFYRFQLNTTSNVSIRLAGLSSDADLQLIRDANSNGLVDSGDVIQSSALAGTAADSVAISGMTAGTYFIRVNKFSSGSTNYNLAITATAGQGLENGLNNTLGTARILEGNHNGGRSMRGTVVSGTDVNDFYRFRVDRTTNFSASISGLSSDADLRLIRDANNNGVVDAGEVIAVSARAGTSIDSISRQLTAGTYFLQVNKFGSGSTNYNLNTFGQPV